VTAGRPVFVAAVLAAESRGERRLLITKTQEHVCRPMTPDFHHTDGSAQPSPAATVPDGLVVAIPAYDAAGSVAAVI
jgi:hypothetical protein